MQYSLSDIEICIPLLDADSFYCARYFKASINKIECRMNVASLRSKADHIAQKRFLAPRYL